jgi:hypothetical protein
VASEIGVMVTRAVRIDREGARSLLRAYSDWLNPSDGAGRQITQLHVEEFLARYADLSPEDALAGDQSA